MLPQFFDMIGLDTQGLLFEQVFWALVVAVGLIIVIREVRAGRPLADAWYGHAIGAGMAAYGGFYLYRVVAHRSLYFDDKGLQISNYGLGIALAFVIAIWLSVRAARRTAGGPTGGQIFDLAFWILIFGLVGARVLFIVVSWKDYYHLCVAPELVPDSHGVQDCWAVLKFWKGGLVFFGGFLGAATAAVVYCKRMKLPFLRTADTLIPYLALGHFFGRIGCLSAGCCFGRPTDVSWGIVMPSSSAAFETHWNTLRETVQTLPPAQHSSLYESFVEMQLTLSTTQQSLPIHPTQLYEASAELLFFVFLLLLRSRKGFHGQILAVWLMLYSVMRFTLEFFRGDTIRGFLFEFPADAPVILTTSQAISLGLGATGVIVYAWLSRKRASRRASGQNSSNPFPSTV